MSYKVTEEGDVSIVHLDGEIDMDVTEKAKEIIMPLIEAKKEVHLNLKEVQYMDSSGISVLIESHQKANELGKKVILKDISKYDGKTRANIKFRINNGCTKTNFRTTRLCC